MIWTQNITSTLRRWLTLKLIQKSLNFIFRRVPNPDRFKVDHRGNGFNIILMSWFFLLEILRELILAITTESFVWWHDLSWLTAYLSDPLRSVNHDPTQKLMNWVLIWLKAIISRLNPILHFTFMWPDWVTMGGMTTMTTWTWNVLTPRKLHGYDLWPS